MSAFIWRSFLSRSFGKRTRKGKVSASTCRKVRLHLEELEERAVPAIITVTSFADNLTAGDGQVTLREAIQAANTNSDGGNADFTGNVSGAFGDDTVDFDATVFATPQTITLSGGTLTLAAGFGTIAITGPAAGVTIDGNNAVTVFTIDSGLTATLSGRR